MDDVLDSRCATLQIARVAIERAQERNMGRAEWGELSGTDTSKMQVDGFGTLNGCTRY